MKTKIFKHVAIVLFLAGNLYSCAKKGEATDITQNVTGTVIGTYYNGWGELLVQVDKKYPIGKTIEYVEITGNCTQLPKSGTYHNMIAVQSHFPISNLPENETVMSKRISFSYRAFSWDEKEDVALFLFGAGNAMCVAPVVPIYIIMDCQILE